MYIYLTFFSFYLSFPLSFPFLCFSIFGSPLYLQKFCLRFLYLPSFIIVLKLFILWLSHIQQTMQYLCLNVWFVFLNIMVLFLNSLYILYIYSLRELKYFLIFVGCLFTLMIFFFCSAEAFQFSMIPFVDFRCYFLCNQCYPLQMPIIKKTNNRCC